METYLIQPFHTSKKGLKASRPSAAKTAQLAIREAERIGVECGAAALHIIVDDETGDTVSTRVLARIGNLPDDFDETVGA